MKKKLLACLFVVVMLFTLLPTIVIATENDGWRGTGTANDPYQISDAEQRKAFADTNEVSEFAMNTLRWAVDKGIITGKGNGILDPKGKATRAEVAAMLMRYCEKVK